MLCCVLLFVPCSARAISHDFDPASIKSIVTTSPSWKTFTDRDGTGLYHDIMREVFGLYNISVTHEYAPSVRAEKLVQQGFADVMTCDDRSGPGLVLSRYPLYVNTFFVFFKKANVGPWNGQETLRDKEVLSQRGYYFQDNFSVPVYLREVSSGEKAVEMIMLDRAEFYVDDLSLIRQSLESVQQPLDMELYDIRAAGVRSYHPQFNTSPRGRALRDMFETGLETLYESGALQKIYEKYGYQCPDLNDY